MCTDFLSWFDAMYNKLESDKIGYIILILTFVLKKNFSFKIVLYNSVPLWFFKGLEYPAVVEFAPFQKISKKKLKKKDAKSGSIEDGTLFGWW